MLHTILKSLKKLYELTHSPYSEPNKEVIQDPFSVYILIKDALLSPNPCMIARFGAFEIATINNYLSIISKEHSIFKYLEGKQSQWWWNKSLLNHLSINAGFYPNNCESVSKFCDLYINDAKEVDIIASWQNGEKTLLKKDVKYISLPLINPIRNPNPWSLHLKGKKVLIIHPFAKTIKEQYKKRIYLFTNPNILPEFELITLQSVQSIGGECSQFTDWFAALDFMKEKVNKINFDIALIACGAYGFPLAAHIKRIGKKAIHIGGPLQLLFGIKGHRWDELYNNYYNQYWVRPQLDERPQSANKIENGCYW